ncbi:MAG: hypothetical protein ABIN89_20000 [Chitinophagaceae bacterium]
MDKQQFDHIENRIRKAADEISIPANEVAWEKIQVLLDDEFNKDHRRRRGGIWWWFSLALLIIAGVGIYFYQNQPPEPGAKMSLNTAAPGVSPPSPPKKIGINAEKEKAKATQSTNNDQQDKVRQSLPVDKNEDLEKDKKILEKQSGSLFNEVQSDKDVKKVFPKTIVDKSNPAEVSELHTGLTKTTKQPAIVSGSGARNKSLLLSGKSKNKKAEKWPVNGLTNDPAQNEQTVDKNNNIGKTVESDKTGGINTGKPSNVDSLQNTVSTATVITPVEQLDSLIKHDSLARKTIKIKSNVPSSKGFYLVASVAGDATGIKKISTKEIKPVYGIGVGYSFNNRLSVQTGFYAGKKIYTAGPDDYKVTPGSYVAKIISAQAECYIYDIPISVRYNVFQRKMYNVYFTTGLSTYIFKRETYDMHFYNPTGTYRRMSYTYHHNTDYLSILNLSLGFERKLSNAFYIQAEPYLKLPLAGLGEGNVKLYSGGLQLGIKYQHIKNKK